MLLAGGEPPALEWFMVQTKSKPRVQRQRLQVQRIFRVKLNAFQSRPDTPYFWLQLQGPRENTSKAKVNSPQPLPSWSLFFTLLERQRFPDVPDLGSAIWPAGTGDVLSLLQICSPGSFSTRFFSLVAFLALCPTPLWHVTSVLQ